MSSIKKEISVTGPGGTFTGLVEVKHIIETVNDRDPISGAPEGGTQTYEYRVIIGCANGHLVKSFKTNGTETMYMLLSVIETIEGFVSQDLQKQAGITEQTILIKALKERGYTL